MNARGLSLRSILTVTTIVVVSLALLGAGSLVAMTSILHQTTSDAAISVESVRLAQEAEIDLLLHDGATNELLRRDIEERITQSLADARKLVTSAREERAIAEAEALVAAYIRAARDPAATHEDRQARQGAAYGALQTLAGVYVALAREAHTTATAWDQRSNYVGTAVASLLIAIAGGLLVWLRSRAFAPVFELLRAMERFGKGERGVRATEAGPSELREMSRRFNELADALAAQRQAQVAFLGGVAHDLKNPLSVLQLSVALVPADEPLPPEHRIREMIAKIKRQISRLDRMASDFLDISKVEAGELELNLGTRDARELVRGVVDLFNGTTPEPNLLVTLPAEAVDLRCDDHRLEQVLTNLISNAIKYSRPSAAIEVALEPGAEAVVFRVTDRGVGIPQAEQQRVFEPFRRVGLSKEAVPGVGLGLFVVRRIVEAHGGRIDVESTPGAGSTFRVHIPRRERTRDGSAAHRDERRSVIH
jgi:two-component system, OmpR family, sensor histidine kinase MtrB